MEFIPTTGADLSTPKMQVITSSLAVVVLTAIGLRFWFKRQFLALAKPLVSTESFAMASKDFGDVDETRRDASRSYSGGAIYLLLEVGAAPIKLSPPASTPRGVDKQAVEANMQALIADLREKLPSLQITEKAFERILPSRFPACARYAATRARRFFPPSLPISHTTPFALLGAVSDACFPPPSLVLPRSAYRQPSNQCACRSWTAADAQG